jgi:MFS transporter, DHA1 family, inner membrane transport protein
MAASMTAHNPSDARSSGLMLWALLAGNFAIGSGVLAPAALINDLATAFATTPARIGLLVSYGAIVLCVGAPLMAYATAAIARRTLLVACMGLYAAGHAASAFATSFEGLLIARLAMISAAAIFTPQAAGVVGVLVAPEKRAGAVTFVFMGWSLAAAFGVPMLGLTGASFGWRAGYELMAFLSLAAGAAVWLTLAPGLKIPPLPLSAWREVLTNPAILLVLAVTMVQLAGQFALFPYLGAELKRAFGAGPQTVALLLGLYGLTGAISGFAMARFVGRIGAGPGLLLCLAASAAGLALWSVAGGSLLVSAIAIAIWGSGFAAGNSMQQARLIAVAPALASASVALNTSVLYLGQAGGAAVGAALMQNDQHALMGPAAVVMVGLAAAISLYAQRRFKA